VRKTPEKPFSVLDEKALNERSHHEFIFIHRPGHTHRELD